MSYSIVVAEQELGFANTIFTEISNNNYHIELSLSEKDFLSKEISNVDLFVIDYNFCNIPIAEFLVKIRNINEKAIIIVIFPSAQVEQIKQCISNGADDVILKTSIQNELAIKIMALLRCKKTYQANNKSEIKFDLENNCIYVDGKQVKLLSQEVKVLEYFLEHQNQIIQRYQLLSAVWGYDGNATTRTVDVHIARLRKKMGDASNAHTYIQTIRHQGYKFVLPN